MTLKLVKRGKAGIYYIQGRLHGRRPNDSTGTTDRAAAMAQLVAMRDDIESGKNDADTGRKSFTDIARYYVSQGGERRFLKPLVEHFGDWDADAIKQADVVQFVSEWWEDEDVSPGTVKRQVFVPINAIYSSAADAELCALRKFKPPKQVRHVIDFPRDEWFQVALPAMRPELRALSLFMTYTGARISEALAVEWSDVDFPAGEVMLRRTKNGKSRLAPMHSSVVEALQHWRRASGEIAPQAFPGPSRSSYNKSMVALSERIKCARFSAHQIGRHAFAARLIRAGHSLKHVMEAGGWDSITVVSANYAHLEDSSAKDAVRALPSIQPLAADDAATG